MATIKFQLRSKNNPANIYVRMTVDREINFRRKTGFIIDPDKWSSKTNLPNPNDADLKNLKTDLQNLATKIEQNLNKAISAKEEITGDWLQSQIDSVQGIKKKTDVNRLVNYIQEYIEQLPFRDYGRDKRTTPSTIGKYTTLKNKIVEFETYKKKRYYLKDVDPVFRNNLLKYFIEVDRLSSNTAGRYIKFLKTVCLDAGKKGFEVSYQLPDVKGFTEKASKVFLSFDELETIENKNFDRTALKNAKDWLIIGCYVGQRVSDLLTLTRENISVRNGLELLEIVQKKTGKRVAIPIHPKVKEILDKRNGQFPGKISDQKFNLHIKEICKLAGIKELTTGAKLTAIEEKDQAKKWRKEYGIFPKHELISSHVCRRSFASNFYGEIPTALLISITAHSTERQFLEYIGKNSNDYAIQIAEYWSKAQLKANGQAPMTVLKNAN